MPEQMSGGLGQVAAFAGEQSVADRCPRIAFGAELPIEPELERWFPLWGIPI